MGATRNTDRRIWAIVTSTAESVLVSSETTPIPSQGWTRSSADPVDGSITFRLNSWARFVDLLDAEVFHVAAASRRSYIWRGQQRVDWSLSSSLDRLFEKLGLLSAGPNALEERSREHLEAFKYASRGRRGQSPPVLPDNDWWALGQHYGLATPLLDWTRSPYAAAYFALQDSSGDNSDYRVVYGLDQRAVDLKNHELAHGPSFERGRLPVIDFVDPLSDDNPRLVSQGGLFTRAPIGMPIERWVAQAFEGVAAPVLVRIEVQRSAPTTTLRWWRVNSPINWPILEVFTNDAA